MLKYMLLISIMFSGLGFANAQVPEPQNTRETREILTSATYGVLAGTLVGAASLAFTDRPGDNLQQVARGASLGLYAGLFLGFYVAYVVPNQGEDDSELDGIVEDEGGDYGLLPKFVSPIVSNEGRIKGAYAQWSLLDF